MPTTATTASPALAPAPAAASAPPVVHLRLLGEAAIDVDGVPVGPESQVLFAVLLVLALERGRRLARTALHRLLWPAADDESGRHNLRQVLYKLRQLGVPVDATQSSVMLPAAVVTGELVSLTSGGHAVGPRLAGGRRVGEFLPGYTPTFSAPFADWVDEQRALIQAQLRRALLATLAEARGLGQWRDVEAVAHEVLRIDPLNEEATLALAEATALAGAKAQALGIIDRYLDEVGGRPTEMRLPASILRRRIAERFPTHRYVSAADACFAGRAAEMAALLALWRRARERRGSGVLIWGEPGIGKTRLAHELARVATLQGAQVQRVASRSWDLERPLGAIVDLVPGLRELPGAAGVDPRCSEHLDRLTKHDPDRPLPDLPDPATLHRQVRQAVFDLVDALLAEAPLVLVFEDVQWLDTSSWEVLAELLRLSRTRRLLLVLTSRVNRPAQMSESADWEALQRMRLDGIDATATNELLDAMTREAGKYIDPDYREWCVPLANGNPLHAQEIALQWLEKGSVREAPGSLKAMLESRLDRLSSPAKLLVQLLVLVGAPVNVEWCAQTGLLTPRELLEASEELLIQRLCVSADATLVTRHPIVEELVLLRLTESTRHRLHRYIATALEQHAQQYDDVTLLWDSARHWARSGHDASSFRALLRCAEHLLQVGLPRDALEVYDLATPLTSSTEDVAILTSGKVLALAHDAQWGSVATLLRDHRPGRGIRAASPSGPATLRAIEAKWRQHEDLDPLIADAIRIATSSLYDGTTRLSAATLALVFSDNRDGVLTEYYTSSTEIRLLLRDLAIHPVERFRHLMILHSIECRVTASADAAISMLQSVDYTLRPFDGSPHRQAAYALRSAGLVDEAEHALLNALDVSRREASISSQLQNCVPLATLALYRQRPDEAAYWCNEAASITNPDQNQVAKHSLHYTLAQLAASRSDHASLLAAAAEVGIPSHHRGNVRRLTACCATLLRARVESGSHLDSVGRELLAEGLLLLEGHQHRGQADFLMSACCRALSLDKCNREADRLLKGYLDGRRLERCALHLDLARWVKQRDIASGAEIGSQA